MMNVTMKNNSSLSRARQLLKVSKLQSTRARVRSSVYLDETSMVISDRSNSKYREIGGSGETLRGLLAPAPEDYYSLLSLDASTAPSPEEVRAAYRKLQRVVHPDVAGPAASTLAVILNACYSTLMDPSLRAAYDFDLKQYLKQVGGSFDGKAVSGWFGGAEEDRAVFVAENECIGCGQCTRCAPNTFYMEDEHGRARVSNQWADDEELIVEAVDSCPVDCIYYVKKSQLPLLEFIMKSCERENVAIMGRRRSGNMGSPPRCQCPFERAEVYAKARKEALGAEESFWVGRSTHDGHLAAAIAGAWLDLPEHVRSKGWPAWSLSPKW